VDYTRKGKGISTLLEAIMTEFEENQTLNEVATVCSKHDGYGMIIEVHSQDEGDLDSKSNPAHAHLKTSTNQYIGKFAITKQPPRVLRDVFDCDKNKSIPEKYKDKIVEWAKFKYHHEEVPNWVGLKLAWSALHP
jgi:hypothetical protein